MTLAANKTENDRKYLSVNSNQRLGDQQKPEIPASHSGSKDVKNISMTWAEQFYIGQLTCTLHRMCHSMEGIAISRQHPQSFSAKGLTWYSQQVHLSALNVELGTALIERFREALREKKSSSPHQGLSRLSHVTLWVSCNTCHKFITAQKTLICSLGNKHVKCILHSSLPLSAKQLPGKQWKTQSLATDRALKKLAGVSPWSNATSFCHWIFSSVAWLAI